MKSEFFKGGIATKIQERVPMFRAHNSPEVNQEDVNLTINQIKNRSKDPFFSVNSLEYVKQELEFRIGEDTSDKEANSKHVYEKANEFVKSGQARHVIALFNIGAKMYGVETDPVVVLDHAKKAARENIELIKIDTSYGKLSELPGAQYTLSVYEEAWQLLVDKELESAQPVSQDNILTPNVPETLVSNMSSHLNPQASYGGDD